MIASRIRSWVVAVGLLAGLASQSAISVHPAKADDPPRRFAFLVGVNTYEKAGFKNLDWAVNDAKELREELLDLGFDKVVLLTSEEKGDLYASKTNIETQLERMLADVRKKDIVLVMFSGHGQQLTVKGPDGKEREDGFFCPVGAKERAPSTWISLSWLTDEQLTRNAETNLVFIDACRSVPITRDPDRGTSRGLEGKDIFLRKGMGMFFSCSENQVSIEKPSLKHGVFTYALLSAVRELNERGRAVTWDHIVAEVKDRVPDLNPDQIPVSSANVPRVELGRARRRSFAETIGLKMVPIPRGSFLMGTTNEQIEQILKLFPDAKREFFADEQPAHRVEITRNFELSAHEITVGQFRKFVEDTGYRTEAEKDGKGGWGIDQAKGEFRQDPKYTWRDPGFPQGEDHPVVNVSYNDALEFCGWLSRKDGRIYRLPTEAEWEYACRAGRETLYYNGDDPERLAQIGNVADARVKAKFADWTAIAADDGFVFTAPVGQYQPNGFGLFDMTGNVWEWCLDYYEKAYYNESPPSDPRGPAQATHRVLRGGGWSSDGRSCRSAFRDRDTPDYRFNYLGFRVARVSSR